MLSSPPKFEGELRTSSVDACSSAILSGLGLDECQFVSSLVQVCNSASCVVPFLIELASVQSFGLHCALVCVEVACPPTRSNRLLCGISVSVNRNEKIRVGGRAVLAH